MTTHFDGNGEVKITMYDNIQKMINEFPLDMIGHNDTAAFSHLFQTYQPDDTTKISRSHTDMCHSMTTQTLVWLSQEADHQIYSWEQHS